MAETGIEPQDETEKEFQSLMFDVKYDKEKFNNPETIGLLMYRLSKQRKETNHLFSEILDKLGEMEKTFKASNTGRVEQSFQVDEKMLSDVDRKIYGYIDERDKVDAAEIKEHLGYKGKNAASARLNSLYKKGYLNKERVGKRVLYWAKGQ